MTKPGKTVRVSDETFDVINKICDFTGVAKGKALSDAIRILDDELKKKNYNYSKILEKF